MANAVVSTTAVSSGTIPKRTQPPAASMSIPFHAIVLVIIKEHLISMMEPSPGLVVPRKWWALKTSWLSHLAVPVSIGMEEEKIPIWKNNIFFLCFLLFCSSNKIRQTTIWFWPTIHHSPLLCTEDSTMHRQETLWVLHKRNETTCRDIWDYHTPPYHHKKAINENKEKGHTWWQIQYSVTSSELCSPSFFLILFGNATNLYSFRAFRNWLYFCE